MAMEYDSPVTDLREWLRRVDALGELVVINEPVDPDEEMAAITYLVGKEQGSPCLLFERSDQSAADPLGIRQLWNILGSSRRRIALTMEEDPEISLRDLIARAKDRTGLRVPPKEVSRDEAPVLTNTLTGSDIDLTSLPIPKHWPLDGGRYAGTGDAVITRDPDNGYLNVGTYRMMLQGPREVNLFLSPGKDAKLHIERAWKRNESVPVAAAWGVDPLFMVIGGQAFAKNVSEYEFLGGVKGHPVPVVRGTATDLLVPAAAEIVIEGEIPPNSVRHEGPFGEFTGYYGHEGGDCPLVHVKAIHYRDDPILTNALMADYPSCEMADFFAILRSARIWGDLEKLGLPGIAGVYSHPAAASGFAMTVISLEQRYPGHASQALSLAAQVPGGAYYSKWIIAVDHDVDPTNINEVLWALSTRCAPRDDIDILRDTWSTWLDPSQNPPEVRPYGSKALINSCTDHRHLHTMARRTALRREIYDRVSSRWHELGLAGEVPPVRAFADDS
ncbi:MAG: UbiD family decarboxylase [Streptosporangiales bacterium]|nr:UbiD family decarboxylase [Streptosporangiales bacterium]